MYSSALILLPSVSQSTSDEPRYRAAIAAKNVNGKRKSKGGNAAATALDTTKIITPVIEEINGYDSDSDSTASENSEDYFCDEASGQKLFTDDEDDYESNKKAPPRD